MIRVALIFSLAFVTGCGSPRPTPRPDLNGLLRQSVNSRRDPSLGLLHPLTNTRLKSWPAWANAMGGSGSN